MGFFAQKVLNTTLKKLSCIMIYISTICLKGERKEVFTRDLKKVLEVYKKNNIKNIELGSVHSYIKDLSFLKKYKKENDANFIIHGFFPPSKEKFFINFASQNETILKKSINIAKNAINLCNEIESNLYSLHGGYLADFSENSDFSPNYLSGFADYEKAFETVVGSLNELCDYAAEYSVNIAVENNTDFFERIMFSKAEDFEKLFKRMKRRNIGILIDLGHLKTCSMHHGFDRNYFIKKLQNKILELHIHDNNGCKDTHNNLKNLDILSDFDRNILKKAALTLEAIKLTPEEILKSKKLLESV